MKAQAKFSLLAIEQAVEAQAKEWQRKRLQNRLQRLADEHGAICPDTGVALQEARYETVTLETCAGTVTIRAHYGRHPQTRKWQHPLRQLWGLRPRQRLSPQLAERVSYTATETDSYERAAKMAAKWGTPLVASTVHKHVQQMGPKAAAQAQERQEQLMNAATQVQAIAPRPNGLGCFCLVVMMDGFMARERGADWALKPPEAEGSRVQWHEVKAATIYRVDQVAQKESGRRQILQKFWVLAPPRLRQRNLAARSMPRRSAAAWATLNTFLFWPMAPSGSGTLLQTASSPVLRVWIFITPPLTCGPLLTKYTHRKPRPKLGSNPCSTN